MYSLTEFLNKINISYNNWDDYGFKTTASINIDNETVFFNVYPNNQDTYNFMYGNSNKNNEVYFSLGGQDYYDFINRRLKREDRKNWYNLTKDLAYDTEFLDFVTKGAYGDEYAVVIYTSFFRFKDYSEVKNQLHRMTLGGKYLDRFKLNIINSGDKAEVLSIDVNPDDDIPKNTFGFIGRNGTGKTHILNNIINLLLDRESDFRWEILDSDSKDEPASIEKVIKISYSPFDFINPEIDIDERYIKIGLLSEDMNSFNSLYESINNRLFNSLYEICGPANQSKKDFWEEIIANFSYEDWAKKILYIVQEVSFNNDYDSIMEERLSNLNYFIKHMSSGQKIILLTINELILNVREKYMVLFDEPELFLHPSLVKSYIRAIIKIITKMNGICIIATHNPLVLQELQTSCVKVTNKENNKYVIRSLSDFDVKSFGENVNVLNNMIFGIDIQNTGYYQYLTSKNQIELIENYDFLMENLGSEGRVLLNHLIEAINEKNR